jgi:Helicase HerA, central domain
VTDETSEAAVLAGPGISAMSSATIPCSEGHAVDCTGRMAQAKSWKPVHFRPGSGASVREPVRVSCVDRDLERAAATTLPLPRSRLAAMAHLHLGFRLDPKTGKPGADRLVVESGDLTTHGVILGMTGSGKTGLGVVLIEEALLAGVPCLVLDPKGDMGNLLLTFPELDAASFRPWVNEDDARSEGLSLDDYAAKTATIWREGLEADGIAADRIRALRDAAELTVYTPGSESGVPLNLVGSLHAPTLSWDSEAETLRDEIEGTVTSLLGLVGIEADPLSSREHVLLANLIEHAWRAGQSLDLGALIGQIQSPPLRKLGVFDVDTFFPPKERTELALKLNGLIASPAFAAWGAGRPLDPATLLRTPDGKPRCAIVYLAHLSDQERQFVVTLVLSKLVTWMRGQPGTSDLRTLAYMDEVFGYVPPTAMPPAKKPILTILKQGRAFGVGMALATQNPVDLDYKAMSNAGTWLVGRLQTERDKARVLEGLRSAAGGTDVQALDSAIGGLQKRQFLLVSAKSSTPALFESRWAMSYLRGPLTKEQIERLMREAPRPAAEPVPTHPPAPAAPVPAADESAVAPAVAEGVPVRYVDPAAPWAPQLGVDADGARLSAFLAARVNLRFDDTKAGIDASEEWEALYGPLDGGLDLERETAVDYDERDFRTEPPEGAGYVLPRAPLGEARFFRETAAQIERRLVDRRTLEVQRNPSLKLYSRPGETAEEFARRCDEVAQAEADREAAKIRDRLEARKDRLAAAVELAQRRVEELDAAARSHQATELAAGAGAVLDALLRGRRSARSIAGRIGSAASRRGVSARAAERRRTAEERVQQKTDELAELEQELLDEIAEIDAKWRERAADLETVAIRLEASDVRVAELALVWMPAP